MNITKEMIESRMVFHCDTEEKANEFCKKIYDLNCKFIARAYLNFNCYNMHKENTCYCPKNGGCYNIDFCKNENYKIIEYELDELDEPSALKKAILGRIFNGI